MYIIKTREQQKIELSNSFSNPESFLLITKCFC